MDNNNKNKDPNHNRQGWGIILATTLLVTFIVMGLYSMMQGSGPEEISYDKFLSLIDEGEVQEVSLNSDRIYITLTDEARREELEETGRTGNPGNVLSQLQDQMQGQMQSGGGTEEESERSPDYYTGYVNDYTLTDKLEKAGVKFGSKPGDTMAQTLLELFLTVILPIGLMALMLVWLMRKMTKGGGVMGIGKSTAKMYM